MHSFRRSKRRKNTLVHSQPIVKGHSHAWEFMSSDSADELSTASVPVTIITGFLGAGKTTLLRHVLATPHGLRIAVIQNELSAVKGLETSTVVGPNGERFNEWLELANGCVCCAVRDDLVNGIEQLMAVRGRFDYILVETDGMADPGPVAESFWLDQELESPLRLDGIVCVVDAINLPRQLRELEACRQIGCADAIILNKMDAVEEAARAAAEADAASDSAVDAMDEDASTAALDARSEVHLATLMAHLSQLNTLAPVFRTTRSQVPLQSILNLGAFTQARPPALATATTAPPPFASFGTFVTSVSGSGGGDGGVLDCKPCESGEEEDEMPAAAEPATPAAAAPPSDAPSSGPRIPARTAGRPAVSNRGPSFLGDCRGPTGLPRGRWLHRDSTFGAVTFELAGAIDLSKLEALFAALFWDPSDFPAAVRAARSALERTNVQVTAPSGKLLDGAPVTALPPPATAADLSAIPLPEMYRSKGVLHIAGTSRLHTLQAVHATYELLEGAEWTEPEEERRTRIVFVGRNLDRQAIADTLRACRADGASTTEDVEETAGRLVNRTT
jgi:G3E family GTPase